MKKVEFVFAKGEATATALAAVLATAPDEATVKIVTYFNGEVHKLVYTSSI